MVEFLAPVYHYPLFNANQYIFSSVCLELLFSSQENVKAFCEAESGLPAAEMEVLFEGRVLREDKRSMKDLGVKDGDMIVIERRRRAEQPAAAAAAGAAASRRAASAGGAVPAGLQLPDFGKIAVPGVVGAPAAATAGNYGRHKGNNRMRPFLKISIDI